MKAIRKLVAFASAALLLGACSQETVLTPDEAKQLDPKSNEISFGTYMGKKGVTRAGYEGSINNDVLKDNTTGANGFGVFAYYTGTDTYETKNGTSNTLIPNFMYNEHIYFDASSSAWKYDNLKYWPNEVASGAVDTQSPAATTTYSNGGNLSFFAYAPYVPFTISPTTDGIVAINAQTDNTGNAVEGDPKISYVLATDGNVVDLLWGTLYGTTANVLDAGSPSQTSNLGITSTATTVNPQPISDRGNNGWQKDILKDYTVNADLTKQKTAGQVGFLFKHALAKIGGSQTGDPASVGTNGLQIVLEIDNDDHDHTTTTKHANTVVTVENITITNKPVTYDNGSGGTEGYVKGGVFNLATGKWEITAGTASDAITHTITREGADGSADLATSIAEPASVTSMTTSGDDYLVNGTVEGVTNTPKNVYLNETNPFVFIPGTIPSFDITITYLVRTFDANLANTAPGTGETGTWTKVKQTIKRTVTFTEPTQLNKQYNLVIHLGLTSVKFTASVSDWDSTNVDTNGDGTPDSPETVDLPLNVD